MSIFSLTIIVIIFSIVRVALVSAKGSTADISWLYTWSNIEVAVCTFSFISVTSFFSLSLIIELFTAIVVSCLASFRQLFIESKRSGHIRKDSYLPLWAKDLLSPLRLWKPRSWLGIGRSYSRRIVRREIPPTSDSTERIVPLRAIHLNQEAHMSSNSLDSAVWMDLILVNILKFYPTGEKKNNRRLWQGFGIWLSLKQAMHKI